MTHAEMVEAINVAIPYSEHITDYDFSAAASLRFTWRNDRFRVSLEGLMVEQVEGDFLAGSNLAIAIEGLIKRGAMAVFQRKSKRLAEGE